ncbi:MAG: class I SAM-dependent methyltransferase [Terriglobales bacterium]
MPLAQEKIEARLSPAVLDELLALWQAEQGAEKGRDLDLLAATLPFPQGARLRVLDLGCGPGDAGRAVHARYSGSKIDCLDRDVFLLAMCAAVNRRAAIPGSHLVRDLWDESWSTDLQPGYDVAAAANTLHWLGAQRIQEVCRDVFRLLRSGGVFIAVEPSEAEPAFAACFAQWKSRQPSRYCRENWQRFWDRANEILGYNHIPFLRSPIARAPGAGEMPVSAWMAALRNAGFESLDVLLRDKDEVLLAAVKP